MTFTLTISALLFAVLAFTLRRNLGFLATAFWTMFPVYGVLLPEGIGLPALTAGLMLIAMMVAVRSRQRFSVPAPLIAGVILAVMVNARELLDPSELRGEGIRLLASVLSAAFVGFIGHTIQWKQGFAWGLLPGGIVLAIAEIMRVLSGGTIHASEVAFGINPIVLGQYAAIAAVVTAFQIFRTAWSRSMWLIFIVLAGGVVATGSRGPLLGLTVAFLYLLITRTQTDHRSRIPRIVALLLMLAVGTLIMMKLKIDFAGWFRVEDADRNAGSRIDAWGGAWTTITSDGLLGAGPGRYFEGTYGATVGLPDDPHNILLEIWSEFGLVLAIVLIVVMVLAWRTSAERGQAFVLLAVAVASVSGALATSLVFWMALALATSTQSLKNDKENVRRILDEYSDGSLKRVKKHKDPHGRGRY